jgi:hypothetical protein
VVATASKERERNAAIEPQQCTNPRRCINCQTGTVYHVQLRTLVLGNPVRV